MPACMPTCVAFILVRVICVCINMISIKPTSVGGSLFKL